MDLTLMLNFGAALFAVVNPLGNLPVFVSFTANDERRVQAFLSLFFAVWIAGGLLLFMFTGQSILEFFGIGLPAFRIAGGILLFVTGLSMIRGEGTRTPDQPADQDEGSSFEEAERRFRDVLIPLGVPIFIGPGSITTVILYSGKAEDQGQMLGLAAVVLMIAIGTGLVLSTASWVREAMGDTGLDIATRILGLFLAAMGVQFVLDGLASVTTGLINATGG